MLYVSGYDSKAGKYAVTDTDDGVVSWVTKSELLENALLLSRVGSVIGGVTLGSVNIVSGVTLDGDVTVVDDSVSDCFDELYAMNSASLHDIELFVTKAYALGVGPSLDMYEFDSTGETLIKCKCRRGVGVISVPPVRVIGDGCFSNLAMGLGDTKIIIPNTVEVIGDSAFSGVYFSDDSVLNLENVKVVGSRAFFNVLGLGERTINLPSVESIGSYAFGTQEENGFGVGGLILGSRLSFIPDCMCCYNQNLVHIEYDNVRVIGERAFVGCESLEDIVIPDGCEHIGAEAFSHILAVTCLARKPSYFENINAMSYPLVIPSSVRHIGDGAFRCNERITSVKFDCHVTEIPSRAFEGCACLKSITLSESIVNIQNNAFSDCILLREYTIPPSVTRIGEMAFSVGGSLGYYINKLGYKYSLVITNTKCKVASDFAKGRDIYNANGKLIHVKK